MRKAKAIYAELDIPRESATIICILAENERQAEQRESFLVEERKGFRYVLIGGCGKGKL